MRIFPLTGPSTAGARINGENIIGDKITGFKLINVLNIKNIYQKFLKNITKTKGLKLIGDKIIARFLLLLWWKSSNFGFFG